MEGSVAGDLPHMQHLKLSRAITLKRKRRLISLLVLWLLGLISPDFFCLAESVCSCWLVFVSTLVGGSYLCEGDESSLSLELIYLTKASNAFRHPPKRRLKVSIE